MYYNKNTNSFVNAMQKNKPQNNWKKTENQADALKSTTNALLDLFGTIGALRTRSEQDIIQLFDNAFSEDKLLALKMSFYARNIRGGLGERRVARTIWKWLAYNYPQIMRKNLSIISQFGRWDDFYEFVNTPLEETVWDLIHEQWGNDVYNYLHGKPISLLAKWLKSPNTSSKESVALGKLTANKLGLSETNYRRMLAKLRNYLNVVEAKMSANEWNYIDYEKVPSKAMTNYRKAFGKHDQDHFAAYLEAVKSGEAKIHSGTLFPYDILEKVIRGEESEVLEQQWKALPDYVDGKYSVLVMADVSGSMSMHSIRPLATSIGLAIYFAERNLGPFHNVFMSFSQEPDFVTLTGKNLYEKYVNAHNSQWDMNTDFEKAFRKILSIAIENNIPSEDMPKMLMVISDMEFDKATETRDYDYYRYGHTYKTDRKTYYQRMKEEYAQHGYELPKLVFWNVDARQNTFHAEAEDGVQFASGQATSVFKSILDNSNLSAYDMMVEVLNNPVYDCVRL